MKDRDRAASDGERDRGGAAETNAELAERLRISLVPLMRQLRRQGDAPVPTGSLSALAALDRHGQMSAGELARHEHVTGPMVTRMAKLLEEEGLITRSPSPDDGRVALLGATPAGRRLVHQRRQAKNQWLAQQLDNLDPDDVRLLAAVIPVFERLSGWDVP